MIRQAHTHINIHTHFIHLNTDLVLLAHDVGRHDVRALGHLHAPAHIAHPEAHGLAGDDVHPADMCGSGCFDESIDSYKNQLLRIYIYMYIYRFLPAKCLQRPRNGHLHLLLHHQLPHLRQAPKPRRRERSHVYRHGPLRGLRAEGRVLEFFRRELLEEVTDFHGEAQGEEFVLGEGLEEAKALFWVEVCVD